MTRPRIPAALCVLLLTAAFGQPFWGEHAAPSGGGGDPAIDSYTICTEEDDNDPSFTCSHDATGAELLLAAGCGLRFNGSSAFAIGSATAPTYNSVSMSTPTVYVQSDSSSGGYPDCGMWLLASPSSGSNNFAMTWDNNVYSGWFVLANLVNVAGTQDGATASDRATSGVPTTTTAVTLTPVTSGNLLVHFGTTRGGDIATCTSDNITEVTDGITGAAAGADLTYCIAASTGTGATTNTMTFSGSDRTASVGQVIK